MDWKYIFKRVIVGVAIFLIIYFLKAYILLDVHAQEISSYDTGGTAGFVDSTTTGFSLNVNTNPWANWGSGYLYFNFSLSKYSGSSTSTIVTPRSAYATSGNTTYVCSIGTATNNNSTWNTLVYSAKCPMNMGSDGLTLIYVRLFDNQAGQEIGSYEYSIAGLMTFEQVSNVDVTVDTSGTTTAINNQITNDNSNTQSIINNQNSNTEQQIESQQVCNFYDKNKIKNDNKALNSYDELYSYNDYGVTDYIPINKNSKINVLETSSNSWTYYCFYNINKTKISCGLVNTLQNVTIPNDTSYIRVTISKTTNKPQFEICQNGNQAIADGQQQINDTLNNDNVDGSTTNGSNFFLDFADHTNPLLDILLFPIRLLDSANDSCSPIPITYLDTTINLPCGDTIFWNRSDVSPFKIWWNLFVGGIAIYYLSLKLFNIVNDSFDPFKDPMNHVGGF